MSCCMVKKFLGCDYEYLVFKERLRKNTYYFSILAICRKTGRYSHINNLNAIWSAYGIEGGTRFEESEWFSTRKKTTQWFKIAQEYLTDTIYIESLEKNLDEDRECGEWENSLVFRKRQKRRKKPVKIKLAIYHPHPAILPQQ